MDIVLIVLAVIPSIFLGWIVYKNDHIEKESGKLLVKLFAGGIGATALVLALTYVLMLIVPSLFNENNIFAMFIYCYIGIALVEEGSKYLFLNKITWNNYEFSHMYDAIVYATYVSLGFATVENILYVIDFGISVAITRAILSVPGHLFFGIFMGYFYGLSKQSLINGNIALSKKNRRLSIIVPVILHGTFDFCLMSQNAILRYAFYGLIIFLYVRAFSLLKRVSKITKNLGPTTIPPVNPMVNPMPVPLAPLPSKYCNVCGTQLNGNYCHNCGNKCN